MGVGEIWIQVAKKNIDWYINGLNFETELSKNWVKVLSVLFSWLEIVLWKKWLKVETYKVFKYRVLLKLALGGTFSI